MRTRGLLPALLCAALVAGTAGTAQAGGTTAAAPTAPAAASATGSGDGGLTELAVSLAPADPAPQPGARAFRSAPEGAATPEAQDPAPAPADTADPGDDPAAEPGAAAPEASAAPEAPAAPEDPAADAAPAPDDTVLDATRAPAEVVEGADDLVLQESTSAERVVSDAVETAEFETLGLTWPADVDATTLDAQVRTRADGVWSEWRPLGTDEPADQTPDDGTVDDRTAVRGGTDALWVGSSDAVQLSTSAGAAAAGSGLRLALVSSGGVTAPADASVSTASLGSAVTTPPRVISRAEWGARAPSCTPDVADRVVGAVVHHTAGSNAYGSPAEAMAQIRNDQRYHIESRGWCDIGYNFLVDKFGNIYEGRANSLSQPVIGVHAGGFNTGTVGISMIGDYSTAVPSGAQLDAVGQVAAWRLAAYQVDPRSTITYRTGGGENSRYPAGAVVQLPAIFAHRDTAFTACPGQAAYDRLGSVRQAATNWYLSWPEWGSGPSVSPQMRLLWDRWGGPDGPIGVPVAGQRCDLAPAGCVQQFTGADVYWSPQTGAQAVGGLILGRYRASGEQAAIGYPTSSVFGCPSSGCTQTFQSGVITWSPGTGAQLVGGAIYGRWQASGGLAAGIGYPTSTVLACDGAAGCTQAFEAGRITWSAATGAHVIGGILGATWDSLGGSGGTLGYPTSTQLACDGATGCAQTFAGGVIAWKADTGARAAGAAVLDEWRGTGWDHGVGFPVESVLQCTTSPCTQRFERGTAVWGPGRPARMIGGVIGARWTALGGASSALGLPTSSVLACDADAGCRQTFDGGAIGWSGRTGAQAVPAVIDARWQQSGGAASVGYAVESRADCSGSGPCVQRFERATATWSARTGAHLVGGIIGARWAATGGVDGPLGLPTSTVLSCDPVAGCTQTFERGSIRWTAASGAVVGG